MKIAKGIVAVAIAMLVALGSVSLVIAQEADISEIVGEIDKNMDELKEATETIHSQTDVILGVEGMPDEVKDMAETVHLSSHGLEFFGVYMDNYIGKLDTFKAEPAKNKSKILVTAGKIEALRKMSIDTEDASEFVTLMELPVMGYSPHDLVHVLIEGPDVKAAPEAKSAADTVHVALHDFRDAAQAMRLNLEELEYILAEPPVTVDISAPAEGIDKDMDVLKEATVVIFEQTDVILGVEGIPEEVADMTETVHLSSHALKHFEVYMERYVGKLETYKAEPEKNKAKILVAAGKIEALRKLYIDTENAPDFVTAMELPVTGKSPHELMRVLMEDPVVITSPEAKSAADAVHTAVHDLEGAAQAMRLNLEELEHILEELEEEATTMLLRENWNFISVPKELADGNNTFKQVFGDVNTSGNPIYCYRNATEGGQAVTATEEVKPLWGYWIYSAEMIAVNLTYDTYPLRTPPTRQLYKGWNAIGFSDTTAAPANSALTSIEKNWAYLIGFDSDKQEYETAIINNDDAGGMHDEDNLMYPMKGYWIYVAEDCELAGISV
ncbi:hypothetical protein C5S32_12545 [ANME-1 cluster archaeon GoMg1]|nr:hypothetical protein [ANME-1 cluster archaeon GoMg1]